MLVEHKLIIHMQAIPIIPKSLAIWGLGQIGVAIKGPEGVVYIDPCLSDVVRELYGDWWERSYPPPLLPNEVINANFYLASHEHQDHLDPITARAIAIASPESKFVISAWNLDILTQLGIAKERIIIPEALEPMILPGTRIKLTVVPAAHYNKEFDKQKGYRYIGFLIEWNEVTFYHSGDTIIYPGYIEMLHNLPTPDIAMVPVNGRDWFRETGAGVIGNFLPSEVAQLARDLEWDVIIPAHNDLFPNNMLPMSQVVETLTTIAPRQKFKILQPGELYYYTKQ